MLAQSAHRRPALGRRHQPGSQVELLGVEASVDRRFDLSSPGLKDWRSDQRRYRRPQGARSTSQEPPGQVLFLFFQAIPLWQTGT